ncbi:MAG: VCBS repeat-containing protein, partial [Polyangiaceae bacterium]
MSRSTSAALLLSLGALIGGCAELPDIPANSCGNGVIESGEDCDTFATQPNAFCRPAGTAGACHFDCRERADGGVAACPAGWGCDVDGLCREPTGEFSTPVRVEVGGVSSLLTGDFDGDGRGDIMSREPLDAYGRSRLRFHYFDTSGALTETRLFPTLVASPSVAELTGDGRSDVVFSDFRVGMLLGQADRGLLPETFAFYHVPRTKVRMVAVYDELINDESALIAVTTINGVAGYYSPNANQALLLRAKLPGPLETLAGDPVEGNVFDDPRESPCREIIAAVRGATEFTVVDVCTRSSETGDVDLRVLGLTTTIALDPPAAIDNAPLIADIDVDGHLDVLVGAAGRVYVAHSDGQRLSTAVPYRLALANDQEISPDIAMPLAAGDFTGDGAPDFVLSDRLLTSNPLPNSPVPRYEVVHLNAGARWTEARIADLNANGILDVVAASSGRLGIDFFNGTGTRYLTDFTIPTSGPVAQLAVADLDGDLISDLAFVEKAAATGERDAIAVSFGQLAGAPLAPATIARVARTEELSAFAESGRGSLIVSSAEGSEGEEGGALTLLVGNGNRLPFASLGLSSISLDGQVVNAVALGLSVGSLIGPQHH